MERHRIVPPTIRAPAALRGWRLDLGEERFALIEWPSRPVLPERWRLLTDGERSVATLLCTGPGASYAAVAAARGVKTRTVAKQLARAFQKLGVRSRAELCAMLSADAGEHAE